LNTLDRLRRLASRIDRLAAKDEEALERARLVAAQRREAASELHNICRHFVQALNAHVAKVQVALDPPQFAVERMDETGKALFQINVRGRLIQIEFGATGPLISTEEFRIPYILEGEIRCFNQDLLERESVDERLLFCCLENGRTLWRYFDARTYRSGPFDQDFLIGLLEQLL
jgi:hypothetical protein